MGCCELGSAYAPSLAALIVTSREDFYAPSLCHAPFESLWQSKGNKSIISNYCLYILATALGSYQVLTDVPMSLLHSPNVPSCAIQQNIVIVFRLKPTFFLASLQSVKNNLLYFSYLKTYLYYCSKFLYSYKGFHNAYPYLSESTPVLDTHNAIARFTQEQRRLRCQVP